MYDIFALTAKASGFTPFSIRETHNESWVLSSLVFYAEDERVSGVQGAILTYKEDRNLLENINDLASLFSLVGRSWHFFEQCQNSAAL